MGISVFFFLLAKLNKKKVNRPQANKKVNHEIKKVFTFIFYFFKEK